MSKVDLNVLKIILRDDSSISIRSSDYTVSELVQLCNFAFYCPNGTIEIIVDNELSTGSLGRLSGAGRSKLKLVFANKSINNEDMKSTKELINDLKYLKSKLNMNNAK